LAKIFSAGCKNTFRQVVLAMVNAYRRTQTERNRRIAPLCFSI
jgi:hypothetical protein